MVDDGQPGKGELTVPMQSPRSTNTGLVRFVLIVSALAFGILAQLLVANGSFKWAVTPYVLSVGITLLAIARQSFF
jgi:hypothetical protein